MTTRNLKSGLTYYWVAPSRDVKTGYDISTRNLGTDYAIAYVRAKDLNERIARWSPGPRPRHVNSRPQYIVFIEFILSCLSTQLSL